MTGSFVSNLAYFAGMCIGVAIFLLFLAIILWVLRGLLSTNEFLEKKLKEQKTNKKKGSGK